MSETTHPDAPAGAPTPPQDARTERVDREEVAEREAETRRERMEEEGADQDAEGGDEGRPETAREKHRQARAEEGRLEAARRKHAERLEILRVREANDRSIKGLRHPLPTTPGIDLGGVDLSTPEGCGRAELAVLLRALAAPLIPPIWAREMSTLLRDRAEALREVARRERGEPVPSGEAGGGRSRPR